MNIVAANKSNTSSALALMVCLFFVFGIITVFNDVLIPYLKSVFDLSYMEAILVQFVFFSAYFLMSVPSALLIRKLDYKASIIGGLMVIGLGCLLFYPASAIISYPLFLMALFVMASGITLLQVAANPYITALGDPSRASSRLNLAGGFNSFATVIGPLIGAHYILSEENILVKTADAVQGPYLVLAGIIALLSLLTYFFQLPNLTNQQDENPAGMLEVLKYRHLRLGVIAIFLYVGAEVTVGSFLISYLGLETIAGLSAKDAASYVSLYWGGAMVGRFIGFGFLHRIKSRRALLIVSITALTLIGLSHLSSGPVAMWSITAIGLCHSVMWPCIFPLAIKDLGKSTSDGSGLLIMGVVGGAFIPLLQGLLADNWNLHSSFLIAGLCYLYLMFYAMNGYKVIRK